MTYIHVCIDTDYFMKAVTFLFETLLSGRSLISFLLAPKEKKTLVHSVLTFATKNNILTVCISFVCVCQPPVMVYMPVTSGVFLKCATALLFDL